MRKLTALWTACIIVLIAGILIADNSAPEQSLPIGFTAEELTRLDEIGIGHIRTAPPPAGVIRNPAEWEPSEGVIIRYPLGLSYSVVAEMSEDVIVYTIVSSVSQQTTVTNLYQNNGVNMDNVEFIIGPTDTHWTRDYGPWFIFDGNGDFGIVDQIYNRPRPNDDSIPRVIGHAWNVPIYGMSLIGTGGNYMSDGIGQAMATTLTITENPGLTVAEIDSLILNYCGNDYFMYPDPLGEYIEHIDCWGKFLNPQTVMVLEVPSYHSQYDELNDAADSIAQLTSSWGQPYNVVRVYSTGTQAYTNSLILNGKVFVPVSGSTTYDSMALQAYSDAMPGYEVLGFTGSWYNTDALHCRAMGVPDREMLAIYHNPLFVSNDTINDYEITAEIIDHSETGLISDSLKIYYNIDDGGWQSSMLSAGVGPDEYTGSIPTQPYGTTIKYYLKAADNSGRVETHPYIGEPGPHILYIQNVIPEIALSAESFFFEANQGAKVTKYDTLSISNSGSGVLDWDVSNQMLWLTLSPGSGVGPDDIQLQVNTGGLVEGTYLDTITVSATGAANSPQYVEVYVNILPSIPTIAFTYPPDGADDIPIEANITVTFAIDMDPATIIVDNFLVYSTAKTTYDGELTYDSLTRAATFNPYSEFGKLEQIFVQLNTDITSLQGVHLADNYVFDFWTETNHPPYVPFDPSPADGAEGVLVTADLSWSGGDPDEDDVTYAVYFGPSDPPGFMAGGLTDPAYDLPVLNYDTEYFWYVRAYDGYAYVSGPTCSFTTELDYICGDANGDEEVNVSDAVSIINYVFAGGNPPDPIESGNVNCDTEVNVSDAVWIINYVFVGGNIPCDTDGDDIPDC
jgi:agmatine deiminase